MFILFWALIITGVFIYAGYPLVVWSAGRLRRKYVFKKPIRPDVSLLIAAYNEEEVIGQTIENKLALRYPKNKLEVIIISDASTDRTNEIVQNYKRSGVNLIVQPQRLGKTAALNRGVEECRGKIVVFSDANSIYHRDALVHLIENFGDPRVGYVTGRMVYKSDDKNMVGKGCQSYMSYENRLRELETRTGSVVGVDGGIDAIRKKLYSPMSHDSLPDFVLPLQVVARGFRVVYEPEAVLEEHALSDSQDEIKMRVRVILRSFHTLWKMRKLLNPFRYGFYSFQLLVHKCLRYTVGILQILVFMATCALADRSAFYAAALGIQGIFYLAALTGVALKKKIERVPLVGSISYFCLLNTAALVALWKFIKGENVVVWQPRKGYERSL